jgi:hypothetical protein
MYWYYFVKKGMDNTMSYSEFFELIQESDCLQLFTTQNVLRSICKLEGTEITFVIHVDEFTATVG